MPALTREATLDSSSSPSDSGKGNDMTAPPSNMSKETLLDEDRSSLEGIAKLEEFVDLKYLPDYLVVNDRSNITNLCPDQTGRESVCYKRVYPKVEYRHDKPRTGILYLDSSNAAASGRRSHVHRAPLVAKLGPKDEPRKRVLVAAKTAKDDCRSHHLLRQEAKGYSQFPREFFTDSKPIPVDAPLRTHTPAMLPRGTFPGWGTMMRPKCPDPVETDPPIVPKFYGFYVPVNSKGQSLAKSHSSCKDFPTSDCHVPHWAKCILLMEDCGEQIEPGIMPIEEREQCLELVQRMHRQGFSHGYAHPRNMLVQPGPLSVPMEDRSMETPSFRLVSFGRWRSLSYPLKGETLIYAKRAFGKGRESDVFIAMHELGLITSIAETSEIGSYEQDDPQKQ